MESIDKYLKESLKVAKDQIDLKEIFLEIAEEIYKKMSVGGTIFFCGNGGSAADSQHLAAELIGRFKKNREDFTFIWDCWGCCDPFCFCLQDHRGCKIHHGCMGLYCLPYFYVFFALSCL